MASKSGKSPKTRNQKKSCKAATNSKESSPKLTESPAPESSSMKEQAAACPNLQDELNHSKFEQLNREVQRNYGAKPHDIVCGFIPDMLKILINHQHEMMNKIINLEDKVSSLVQANEDLSAKLLSTGQEKNTSTSTENDVVLSDGIVNRDKTNHILQILIEEREQNSIRSTCQDIKSKMLLTWNEQIKKRELHFRNYIKNTKKADLYEDWLNNSPNYIPLKYRPKRVPGELPNYTKARIRDAESRYKSDCKLMREYASHHREKYSAIDKQMRAEFRAQTEVDEYLGGLVGMWNSEIQLNETRTNQLWLRNEKFLKKKKFEDESNNTTQLTDVTLHEKLNSKKVYNKHSKFQQYYTRQEIYLPGQQLLNYNTANGPGPLYYNPTQR